jgi:type VI secretion system protein ImpM
MSKPALTPAPPITGWFGKIPNLGDFASRRLPDVFVRGWDRWLQRGLTQARSDLGQAWQEAYQVAPILRFWVARGLLGDGAWAGLLMPSVDRVGRQFPLTLARPFATLAAALAEREWFAALDRAARRALDIDFTIDDLERELTLLSRLDPAEADRATETIANSLLGRHASHQPCTLWWHDDDRDEAGFLGFAGLPPATEFASMLGVQT